MSWRYEIMLKSNITYDNGYIYTDFETGELIYISHLMPADTLCLTDRPNFPKRSDNVKRAKDKIFDIVALNEWSYFLQERSAVQNLTRLMQKKLLNLCKSGLIIWLPGTV